MNNNSNLTYAVQETENIFLKKADIHSETGCCKNVSISLG
jgi:hypothetical protein